jgi:hypothetical protein
VSGTTVRSESDQDKRHHQASDIDSRGAHRELTDLQERGLLIAEKQNRGRVYLIDETHPAFTGSPEPVDEPVEHR